MTSTENLSFEEALKELEATLVEASLEYIRHGKNHAEVEFYAQRVLEERNKEINGALDSLL